MKFLLFCALGVAAQLNQWGPQAAGQTFLVQPQLSMLDEAEVDPLVNWRLNRAKQFLSQKPILRTLAKQKVLRSLTSSRSARAQPILRTLVQQPVLRSLTSAKAPRVRVIRSSPQKEIVHNQQASEQRVLRTPISRTMTILPNEVTRLTRNIETHMPMIHQRKKYHYGIEDVNKKNIVHHFVEPVENVQLGTKAGRSFKQQTEHVMEQGTFPQKYRSLELEDEELDFETGSGCFWQVLEDQSCECALEGEFVRPKAVCVTKDGVQVDDAKCNSVPYPEDIMCNGC